MQYRRHARRLKTVAFSRYSSHSPSSQSSSSCSRRGSSSVNVVLIVLVAGLAAMVLYQAYVAEIAKDPRAITPRGSLAESEKSQIEIFQLVAPSVVYITSISAADSGDASEDIVLPRGSGSGFFWDDRGHIVTNYHVIAGADRWLVTLHGQAKSYSATLVGIAPHSDIAVLKISPPKSLIKKIPIGKSDNLQVGQNVFAIGGPYGLYATFSTGVISGLRRTIESASKHKIHDVIQTDAAINPGNSGGPLLDSAGLLIGVNTAIVSPSGASAGIGFSVPVSKVRKLVPQLIEKGKIIRPGLGVTIYPNETVKRLVRDGDLARMGVLVDKVNQGSGAAEAGIQPTVQRGEKGVRFGDLIIEVDGHSIKKATDLFDILDEKKIGETVTLIVLRNRQKRTVEVTLKALE